MFFYYTKGIAVIKRDGGKMKSWRLITGALALAAIFCPATSSALEGQPTSVSLIRLIANPGEYDGKFVRVEGYLHNKFEDSALYISKDDADYLIGQNGIWVSYGEKAAVGRTDCKPVLLEGVFNRSGHGHMGMFAGELKSVSRIMELTRWYDGNTELKKGK